MPKRSRSASPVIQPNRHREDEVSNAAVQTAEDPSGHTPKYFRASASPLRQETPGEPPDLRTMECTLPPHAPLTLDSAAAFDVHYAQEHTNRCYECDANLPSAWMLELHINERHNPLVAAQRDNDEKTVRFSLNCHDLIN